MREDQERHDAVVAELGAVTTMTEGDPLPTKKEQVFITDHWDAG